MQSVVSALRVGTVKKLTAAVASSSATAFGAHTHVVRLASADNAFHFRIGPGAQTAVTTDSICPGAWAEYVLVHPGEIIAVIRAGASDANVTCTEMDA